MKTHTVTTYSASELREQFPQGFERALDHWRNRGEIFWQDETIDSLKALLKAANVHLADWSLGAYNRGNFISVEFPYGQEADFSGRRAMAWLENNLLGKLRIPWSGKGRSDVRKYGQYYRPGLIAPCPFTGYCADDEYLSELVKNVRAGESLKDAFQSLADTCEHILERDCEDQNSEDYFCEHADANDYQFTEDGKQF